MELEFEGGGRIVALDVDFGVEDRVGLIFGSSLLGGEGEKGKKGGGKSFKKKKKRKEKGVGKE